MEDKKQETINIAEENAVLAEQKEAAEAEQENYKKLAKQIRKLKNSPGKGAVGEGAALLTAEENEINHFGI